MSGPPKLAVSNIAWAPEEAREAYALLAGRGFTGLEIAPGLTFAGEADVFRPSPQALAALRADLAEFDLKLVSMQSLLFGVSGAQLFGSADELAVFESALGRAIDLAEMLALPNLVFGSPGNRAYPAGMGADDVAERSGAVFRRLGDRAAAAGTRLAIEPNPAAYNTNFLTTVRAAADYVAWLDHPAVTLNFDIGALHLNGEADQAGTIFAAAGPRVSHVHISEPQLGPAPADAAALAAILAPMLKQGYDRWFSIEMRSPGAGAMAQLAASLERTRAAFAIVSEG